MADERQLLSDRERTRGAHRSVLVIPKLGIFRRASVRCDNADACEITRGEAIAMSV
jgi:hypothetical protein